MIALEATNYYILAFMHIIGHSYILLWLSEDIDIENQG